MRPECAGARVLIVHDEPGGIAEALRETRFIRGKAETGVALAHERLPSSFFRAGCSSPV